MATTTISPLQLRRSMGPALGPALDSSNASAAPSPYHASSHHSTPGSSHYYDLVSFDFWNDNGDDARGTAPASPDAPKFFDEAHDVAADMAAAAAAANPSENVDNQLDNVDNQFDNQLDNVDNQLDKLDNVDNDKLDKFDNDKLDSQIPSPMPMAMPLALDPLAIDRLDRLDRLDPLDRREMLSTPPRAGETGTVSPIASQPAAYSLAVRSGLITPHYAADVAWTKTPLRSLSMPAALADHADSLLATPASSLLDTPLSEVSSVSSLSSASLSSSSLSTASTASACPLDLETPAGRSFLAQPPASGTNPFYRPPPCMRSMSDANILDGDFGIEPALFHRHSEPLILSSPPSPRDVADVAVPRKRSRPSSRPSRPAKRLSVDRSPVPPSPQTLVEEPALDEPTSKAPPRTASSTDDKPFGCEQCRKSFRRMEHLKRHMKIHTMERPYMCSVPDCNRKFSRSDNLKAHILTHAKPRGRNKYVEGLVGEKGLVAPIKHRKSKTT